MSGPLGRLTCPAAHPTAPLPAPKGSEDHGGLCMAVWDHPAPQGPRDCCWLLPCQGSGSRNIPGLTESWPRNRDLCSETSPQRLAGHFRDQHYQALKEERAPSCNTFRKERHRKTSRSQIETKGGGLQAEATAHASMTRAETVKHGQQPQVSSICVHV